VCTAAVLHQADGIRAVTPEVTVPRGTRVTCSSARIHESGDLDLARIRRIHRIPTTDAARISVDLGAVCTFERYEKAMDDLLGRGVLTWEVMLDVLLSHAERGRNGVGALRALLVDRYCDEVSDSALERAFERLWRRSGLPAPTPQHNIFDAQGFIARVDFSYPELKIAIELDSRKHHLHGAAFEADPRKRNRLKLAGWLVLEYTWRMVMDHPQTIIREIRQAIGDATV
jgi:hypothetical protein